MLEKCIIQSYLHVLKLQVDRQSWDLQHASLGLWTLVLLTVLLLVDGPLHPKCACPGLIIRQLDGPGKSSWNNPSISQFYFCVFDTLLRVNSLEWKKQCAGKLSLETRVVRARWT